MLEAPRRSARCGDGRTESTFLAVQGMSLRFLALPRQCPPLKTRRGKTQKPLTDQGLGYFRGSKRKPSAGVGRFSAKGTKIYAFFWKVWKGGLLPQVLARERPLNGQFETGISHAILSTIEL